MPTLPRGTAEMLFEDWASVGRVVLSGGLAYVALVALLRVSGKRTLSKMNAFDLVVTVALGSTLATVLTSRDLPVVNGVVALATLIALQLVVAWLASRSPRIDAIVKARPRVVFHDGAFARAAMREERLTEEEVRAAVRGASLPTLEDVESVVLESSGEMSVVPRRRLAGAAWRRPPSGTEPGERREGPPGDERPAAH